MITYTEKGIALHEAIRAAGHWLKEINGVWISDDDNAVQAIIDGFNPVIPVRNIKISEVKAEAGRRINALYPAWKQANMTARGVELQDIFRINGAWTQAEQAEYSVLASAWAAVKAIRSASDAIENDILAMTDWQQLSAFDVTTSDRWP